MRRADTRARVVYSPKRFSWPVIRPGATVRSDCSALIPALETAATGPAAAGRLGKFGGRSRRPVRRLPMDFRVRPLSMRDANRHGAHQFEHANHLGRFCAPNTRIAARCICAAIGVARSRHLRAYDMRGRKIQEALRRSTDPGHLAH